MTSFWLIFRYENILKLAPTSDGDILSDTLLLSHK